MLRTGTMYIGICAKHVSGMGCSFSKNPPGDIWRLVKNALISENELVKEQLAEAKKTLRDIQEEFAKESLQGTSSSSSDTGCSESESSETPPSEGERKKKKSKLGNKGHKGASAPPPPYNPTWPGEEHTGDQEEVDWDCEPPASGGVMFKIGNNIGKKDKRELYPVVEVPDPNSPRQMLHQYRALSFKEIKQLKEVVTSYGPQAPFTKSLFESFTSLNLTSSDWQQLCRAVLSGGIICCGGVNVRNSVPKWLV